MTSNTRLLAGLLLGLAACKSTPVASAPQAAPAPAASTAAQPTAAEPGAPAAAPAPAKKADGSPDLAHETGCVLARWSTASPKWERDSVGWNAQTRTLDFAGTTRHLNAQGRVQDFGPGKDRLAYDAAGNITTRGGAATTGGVSYAYKNRYDAQQRLVSVTIASTAGSGKQSAFAPYRDYGYDAQGRVDRMHLQIVPRGPLVSVKPEWNERGQLTALTWGDAGALQQRERFAYDANGRLVSYERDGLIVPPGRPADGKLDWTQHWDYDAQGAAIRMDGIDGVDAEQSPHEQTLWSPGCAELGKLWQELYVYPYVPLPAALVPRFANTPADPT